MPRFFAFAACLASSVAIAAAAVVACGSSEEDLPTGGTSSDASTAIKRDSAPVDPVESGAFLDAGLAPPPTCEKYCDLVTTNCMGANAQYASKEECLGFCTYLPLWERRTGAAEEKTSASVACRQYWADGPAKTDPAEVCLSAGPFGGSACGDRCTAFCDVVLSACSPDGGAAPYEDRGACATACASFSYRDAGLDGGGEGPSGPAAGDSLNCRLFQLRAAVLDPKKCATLRTETTTCKD